MTNESHLTDHGFLIEFRRLQRTRFRWQPEQRVARVTLNPNCEFWLTWHLGPGHVQKNDINGGYLTLWGLPYKVDHQQKELFRFWDADGREVQI